MDKDLWRIKFFIIWKIFKEIKIRLQRKHILQCHVLNHLTNFYLSNILATMLKNSQKKKGYGNGYSPKDSHLFL